MNSYKAKRNIFTGWFYPLLVAALVLAGSFTGLEVYTGVLNIVIVSIALLVSNTIKPFLFFILTFAYQMPVEHLYPSDHYTTGYRPYLILGSFALLAAALVVFIVKNQIFYRAKLYKIPLFFPLCVLTVGVFLNGFGRPDYNPMNLVWALLMMLGYFFLYVVVYLGIKGEDTEDMVQYFTYLTLLMSWILLALMAKIYFVDGVVVNGVIIRDRIKLGFGVCNLIGFHISTLIPVNFYGYMKGKLPITHMITALLLTIASIATTSRNAMLFGIIYFFVGLILCLFFGKRKEEARIVIPLLAVVFAVLVVVFKDDFIMLVELYIRRGMDSSGRIDIWKKCVEIFKENKIFGIGFFGMQVAQQFVPEEFIPEFAHNTIFELIAATGIVGTVCYGFYRLATLKYVLYKPSLERFMILMGASVLLAEGLLDNYVFQIYTTFYYVIALAIAARLYEKEIHPTAADYDYIYRA